MSRGSSFHVRKGQSQGKNRRVQTGSKKGVLVTLHVGGKNNEQKKTFIIRGHSKKKSAHESIEEVGGGREDPKSMDKGTGGIP